MKLKKTIAITRPVITTALVALLTVSTLMATLSIANADATKDIDTFVYISPAPNPVGVDQQIVVTYAIDKLNPIATMRSNHYTGFTVTIEKPDKTTETKTNLSVESTSTGYFLYTPTQVGNYYFQINFPGQWVNSSAGDMTLFGPVLEDINRWYKPSESSKVELVVQQEPIPNLPFTPLPTNYWTTPINSDNKGWTKNLDNWLMQGYDFTPRSFDAVMAFSPYTIASNSPHIMWTKPITFGGIVSAQFGDDSYYTGLTYEQFYTPIILSGRIIYNDHGPTASGIPGSPFGENVNTFGARCLDLYTGKEIWYLENTTIDFAQTLLIDIPNKHGLLAYLWSAPSSADTLTMYDAWTGRQILTVANASSDVNKFGPNGEILSYSIDLFENTLTMWNSTKCILASLDQILVSQGDDYFSPAVGTIADWNQGIQWTVTIPHLNSLTFNGIITVNIDENAILVGPAMPIFPDQAEYPPTLTYAAYPATLEKTNGAYPTSIEPLWVKNITDINNWQDPHPNINEGMFSIYDNSAQIIHTYSIDTGNEISVTPVISENGTALWNLFSFYGMAYGRNYNWGYDGHVRCFDGQNGSMLWDFALHSSGIETAYGNYPLYGGLTIADHKLYISPDEHTPNADLWRGSKLYCLDADTGQLLWNISGYYQHHAISNGYVTALNSYDQTIYTFGKGPSATTVTAPAVGVTTVTPITISGSVMDVSAGASQDVIAANFPNGLPCVSDESQGDWMGHVYMQQPLPSKVTGVTVTLSVLDSNNNYRDIGTAVTDTSGTFALTWTPDIPGDFTVTATFAGTNSYYGSCAEAHFTTVEPPQATPAPTPQPSSAADLYFLPMSIGIIIAIVVVGLVIVLMLRKR